MCFIEVSSHPRGVVILMRGVLTKGVRCNFGEFSSKGCGDFNEGSKYLTKGLFSVT